MISEPRPEFWELYHRLPRTVRAQAKKAYTLFLKNPAHPSLRFKPLKIDSSIWSVRVGLHYRAAVIFRGRGEFRSAAPLILIK